MSKITVTTIAGATSGADANKVKIESGDTLEVVTNATVGGTLGVGAAPNATFGSLNYTQGTPAVNKPIISGYSQGNSNKAGFALFNDAGNRGIWTESNDFLLTSTYEQNSAVHMKIDASGRVTKPSQPCFSATATTTNIPLTTGTTVTLSSERFDVGNNLASNIFTAPITGKYLFTYLFYLTQLDAGHTTFDAHILTSNKQYQQTWNPSVFMNSDGNFSVSGSVIADMDVNDTCRFNVYVSGGGAQTDIHGDSHVSGCLLF